MPMIEGTITDRGAVVGVLIGVSPIRRQRLISVDLPVPETISLFLEIDSGSALTGFPTRVYRRLGLSPIRTIAVGTPSTEPGKPHLADQYDISLTLVSGMTLVAIPNVRAIAAEDFDEEVQGILGRDVLNRCNFEYYGPERRFRLGF